MMSLHRGRTLARRWPQAVLAAIIGAALSTQPFGPPRAGAAETITGAGSTWSQIAVDQWRADVARQGLTVNYQGVGSTSGRSFYTGGQTDFAVSEIPFQDGSDGGGVNEIEAAKSRPYVYLPIVAGGTAFMYHLDVAGKRVTDLRLQPTTVTKIFTGVIRSWDDAAITADNNGRQLPKIPIKVVIRSDGSGTSAQFTAFMASQTPNEYRAFCQVAQISGNCRATSFYPNPPSLGFAAQQFSDGVANFVAAPYNNGAITYVEYGYAKERGFPVAAVRNKAGQYTLPLAGNVSKALEGAGFNPDGTQVLTGVYNHPDPGAYPVSSYSYMIAPTTEAPPFNAAKGKVLSDFIIYFVCAGQAKAEQLGYAPLPRNLIQSAFTAVNRIPGHSTPPSIEDCGAPPPPPPAPPSPTPSSSPATTVPGSGGVTGGTGGDGPSTTLAGGGTVVTDPATGDTVPGDAGGGPVIGQAVAYASPVDYPAGDEPLPLAVYLLAALTLLVLTFGPPLVAARMRRREESQ